MRKVEGHDYLYQRGGKYLVRMQVPEPLRDLLGKGELKKSLGGDRAEAIRERHKIIAEFQNVMGSARPRVLVIEPSSISHDAIDTAVYDHFQRLALRAREAALSPDHANPRSRQGRMEGLRQHIELMLDSLDADDFLLVGDHADLLISEQGWDLPEADGRYKYLCQRVMRARLAAFRAELKRLEGDFSEASKVDPDFGPAKPKPKPAHTIGALIESFNKVREAKWATSTAKNYVIITRVLEEVCGRDTPLTEIDEDFCRGVLAVLQQLPSNYQKKALTKGKPIPEVIEIAAAEGMPLLQPATVKMHLDKLGAFVRYGRDKGWITGNPMALVQVFDPIDPSDKRDPFSIDQLNKIFELEPWLSGSQRPDGRPSRYWTPLIALFSGARLGEICGTRLDEIVEQHGAHLFDIRHREDRRVKTGRSRRVPIHPALVRLGFMDFVQEQRDAGEVLLFPEEKANSLGLWGDAVTDWFTRTISPLDLIGRRLTMHAFRHTFEDALREADLHDTPIASALTGRWSPGHSKNYGTKGFPTKKLTEAIEQVSYPGLILTVLAE